MNQRASALMRTWRTEAHIVSYRWSSGRRMWVPKVHEVVPNIITTVGDKWSNDKVVIAAGFAAETAVNDPDGMILGHSVVAPSKTDTWALDPATPGAGEGGVGSEFQAFSAVTDDEANSRVTWAASWTESQCAVATAITEVAIVPTPGVGGDDEAIVRLTFSPVDKSGADTPLNITIHWNNI